MLREKLNLLVEEAEALEEMFYEESPPESAMERFCPNVNWEVVEQHGGEGQGDDYYVVFKFTDGFEEAYVKLQGYYTSYEGSTYENWSYVTPRQKTITVYE